MEDLKERYISTGQVAELLGIKRITASQLCQKGRLPAVKIANHWLVPRDIVEEFAKTYVPRMGRPRTKRNYTKRHPKWFKKEGE